VVEGLSQRAPDTLKAVVQQAAKSLASSDEPVLPATYPVDHEAFDSSEPQPFPIKFYHDDLILGAAAHKEAFKRAISRALSRLIIHSTFIRREQLEEFWPDLCNLAKSGVVVDILWGAGEARQETNDTADVVDQFRRKAAQSGVDGNLRIHLHSTGSHAKFLVYDDKSGNRVFAIVGSCNWLSTRFSSYETSVRFGDPKAVSEILSTLADITIAPNGGWNQITSDIAALATAAAGHKPYSGVNAQFALVLGRSHGDVMRKARDSAVREITIISHRVSEVARTAVLAPLGARSQGVAARVLFNQEGEGMPSSATATLIREAQQAGIVLKPTGEDAMHGKLLAWDDDNLVITSQNWLSRDMGARGSKAEIGVWLEAKGLAKIAVLDLNAKFGV
jgi:phosphatidylserine/phosphatidylglycerophosphate/cardiolipin synthase-like enzyme